MSSVMSRYYYSEVSNYHGNQPKDRDEMILLYVMSDVTSDVR